MAFDRDLSYRRDYEDAGRAALSADRVAFIRSTFAHLAGAILAFILLQYVLVTTVGEQITMAIYGNGTLGLLLVIGAFIGVSMLAQWWARNEASPATQYIGLGLYVVATAVIMCPLLWICSVLLKARRPVWYSDSFCCRKIFSTAVRTRLATYLYRGMPRATEFCARMREPSTRSYSP